VWPAFLARLSDTGFNRVAQDIAFELREDGEHTGQGAAAALSFFLAHKGHYVTLLYLKYIYMPSFCTYLA
jgi:hypothetical protein